ncbi:NFX1-type zinc finger-containing protein 1 [Desmophyllum pertusum]|uniref:NFX1-type zinc finger-containing protein 1 n=1 Tax=Desmophyllum pertusum TaxID=174260 RepID=A0A9X0CGA9_9CNID|nr:NFX1-type zinc finger-containing protein 1 [Desmophyllum pertusum]
MSTTSMIFWRKERAGQMNTKQIHGSSLSLLHPSRLRKRKITVLTAYTGQLIQLKKEMPKDFFRGVRVCAVDNFQGEEMTSFFCRLFEATKKQNWFPADRKPGLRGAPPALRKGFSAL